MSAIRKSRRYISSFKERRFEIAVLRFVGDCKSPLLEVARPSYFFIRSSTALVIPMIPVRIVGSGTGANLLECRLGNGVPLFLLSAAFAGSTAPTLNINAGIE